jgi:hypothetical protein
MSEICTECETVWTGSERKYDILLDSHTLHSAVKSTLKQKAKKVGHSNNQLYVI